MTPYFRDQRQGRAWPVAAERRNFFWPLSGRRALRQALGKSTFQTYGRPVHKVRLLRHQGRGWSLSTEQGRLRSPRHCLSVPSGSRWPSARFAGIERRLCPLCRLPCIAQRRSGIRPSDQVCNLPHCVLNRAALRAFGSFLILSNMRVIRTEWPVSMCLVLDVEIEVIVVALLSRRRNTRYLLD